MSYCKIKDRLYKKGQRIVLLRKGCHCMNNAKSNDWDRPKIEFEKCYEPIHFFFNQDLKLKTPNATREMGQSHVVQNLTIMSVRVREVLNGTALNALTIGT